MRVWWVLGLLSLSACAEPQAGLEKLDCPAIANVDALLKSDGPSIVIVGEMHGMNEPPAFVEALVCHSVKADYRTTLALEIDDADGRHERFLNSDGNADDISELFENDMWSSPFVDGRSSLAMLELVKYSRVMKRDYAKFNVSWFRTLDYTAIPENDRSLSNQAIEQQMADNILKDTQENKSDKTIVLVGNFHARTDRREYKDISYDFMAKHLMGHNMMTFDSAYAAGDGWNCRGHTPDACRAHKTSGVYKPDSPLNTDSEFKIFFNGDPMIEHIARSPYSPDVFDGVIHLGPVSASPPANVDGRDPFEAIK